jgi:hypothetical protein
MTTLQSPNTPGATALMISIFNEECGEQEMASFRAAAEHNLFASPNL